MNQKQLASIVGLAGIGMAIVAPPAKADTVKITNVELKPTAGGIELILTTSDRQQLRTFTSSYGKTLVTTIVNSQLQLTKGEVFRQENPVEGIATITIEPVNANSTRISVVGEENLPTAQVRQSAGNFIVSLSSNTTATQPTPAQEPSTQENTSPQQPAATTPNNTSEQPAAENELPEIVVTATRTEEEVTDVPRSVTVITRDEIEAQTNLSRSLNDTLSNAVPGLSPTNQSISSFGQNLRGRSVSVLIDGVPQTTNNQGYNRELRTIDPSAIERIEVIRGASATYGSQGAGGVINIITRSPSEEGLTSQTYVGLNTSLTNTEDSFGYDLQHSISSRQDNFDVTASFSIATTGAFYDAQGDRIPVFELGGDNSTTLNGLFKVGVDLTPDQRLQFTFNHFYDNQKPDVISDPIVDELPGTQKARALEVGELEFVNTPSPGNENTIINLAYNNENILGSRLQGQIYYRNNVNRSVPLDTRPFVPFFPEDLGVIRSQGDSEQLGGRLQIETPFNPDETISLLWGADYVNENSEQPFDIIDLDDYDASGGRVNRQIGNRTFVPPYKLGSLGLFAQLTGNIGDVELTGGIRHERIALSVDDYTTFRNQIIPGGERDFSATVFNLGAVYNASDEISLFTNFSQGFGLPDFGLILRDPPAGFTTIEDSVRDLSPQKVNNYEIGVRGNWDKVQATLSAFYNTSDLGLSFNTVEGGFLEFVRAPERIYGLEATVDWQPTERWQIGSTLSLAEGESDEDENGDYLPLTSSRITPLKLTAYIENETLPGWRNRLQALFVGDRNRAFDQEVDLGAISSYITVDYISSIKLGPGSLQIGIENLLNKQYYPIQSQLSAGAGGDTFNYAARGRTLRFGYSITW